ncbi:MAG: hypothetical protein FWC13_05220 [Oscillospiraceae bacterium]|nr:hypothetical protein [Oscillospiraceae bacterium]
MPKTDKELTAEIVCSYLSASNGKTHLDKIHLDNLTQAIQEVHKAISKLEDEKN